LSADEGDEGEGDCTDEEMDARDLTPEEAAAATAVLDALDNDQEGLALTGGDWFNTIKQVAKTNKEAEKELAARMKKAKISQTSKESPPTTVLPMLAPGCCRKTPPPTMTHPPPSSS
jgi:hypothetical protein